MLVFPQLGVTDPLLALDVPALSHQSQQCLCSRAQAGDERMTGLERLSNASACCVQFHDPAGAMPVLPDVVWRLLGTLIPGGVAALPWVVIRCHERDVALSLELSTDLAIQRLLVGFHGQE